MFDFFRNNFQKKKGDDENDDDDANNDSDNENVNDNVNDNINIVADTLIDRSCMPSPIVHGV